ncbi:MAG: thioredoxin [Pseudomonadota bacterium]
MEFIIGQTPKPAAGTGTAAPAAGKSVVGPPIGGTVGPPTGGPLAEPSGAPGGADRPNEKPGAEVAAGSMGLGASAPAGVIKDSTTQSFVRDVIEASHQVPVIVDFWAPWCGPCKQLGPALEKLVRQAAGAVRLVKINVDENQELAAQMRVASIPMVYAFQRGQPVDGFAGAVPESQLRAFIERLTGGTKAPVDVALEQAHTKLKAGDAHAAGLVFAEVLAHDPTNPSAIGGMIRVGVAEDDFARASQIAAGLSPALRAHADIASATAALELALQSQTVADDTAGLREKLAANPADHQARHDLALALLAADDAAGAIEALLEIVRRNRKWNDGAARVQLVKIFDALGPADARTNAGRRQLSSILFS